MATAVPPAPRSAVAGTLIVGALVLVLAWQLAHWTWVFVAPPPVAAIPEGEAAVDLAAVAKLFGAAAPGGTTDATPSSGLRLKGVVAPTPGVAASAIFSTGS